MERVILHRIKQTGKFLATGSLAALLGMSCAKPVEYNDYGVVKDKRHYPASSQIKSNVSIDSNGHLKVTSSIVDEPESWEVIVNACTKPEPLATPPVTPSCTDFSYSIDEKKFDRVEVGQTVKLPLKPANE